MTGTGHGIVRALQMLEVMVGKSMTDLTSDVQKLPQVMINVPANGAVTNLEGSEKISRAVKSVEDRLGENGRVILRPSGTEPLVRVTHEGVDEVQVYQLATELADVVRTELDV